MAACLPGGPRAFGPGLASGPLLSLPASLSTQRQTPAWQAAFSAWNYCILFLLCLFPTYLLFIQVKLDFNLQRKYKMSSLKKCMSFECEFI